MEDIHQERQLFFKKYLNIHQVFGIFTKRSTTYPGNSEHVQKKTKNIWGTCPCKLICKCAPGPPPATQLVCKGYFWSSTVLHLFASSREWLKRITAHLASCLPAMICLFPLLQDNNFCCSWVKTLFSCYGCSRLLLCLLEILHLDSGNVSSNITRYCLLKS